MRVYIVILLFVVIAVLHIFVPAMTYRLGDFVRHEAEFKSVIVRKFACIYHRNTFIARYGSNRKDHDYDFLLNATALKSRKGYAALHVRVGDVIDNNKLSVKELWNADDVQFAQKTGESLLILWSLFGIKRKMHGYTKSRYYYTNIANELKKMGFKKVFVCYGGPTKLHDKSREYISLIKNLFEKKGIQLLDMSHLSPDTTFVFLSNATVYAPSGGGFSKLISALVDKRGGLTLNASIGEEPNSALRTR